jgi:hypothetical protein
MQTSTARNPIVLLLLVLLGLGLSGCGGPTGPTIEIPTNPKTATQANLESLFDQISLQLATTKPGSDQALDLASKQKTIGIELAQRSAAAIRTRLSGVGRVDGRLPVGAVEKELANLDPIKRWDENVYASISKELNQELDSTRRTISQDEKKLAGLSKDDALQRLEILSQLSALAGTGSEAQARYAQQRNEILQNVSKEAEEAIQNEDFEKAQGLLGIVQEVNPQDQAARKKKCEVDGKVILKRFSEALESGRVNSSMTMLTDFSETDCFGEIKDGLAESAAPMAEAFALLGKEATAAKNLDVAFQRYMDSRTISTLLLGQTNDLPGVDVFLKQIDQRYQKAAAAGEYGVAWGYLNVMSQFEPMTPQIRQHIRITKDEIQRRAVLGLTAYPFEDPKNSRTKVGDAVASKVVQHIFRTLPSDVRIVEREQLERILEECKRRNNCTELDTADFIVQGTILDAKVETTEKTGSETRRVVTGREDVTNPEHTAWSQLRDKERQKTPEPPRTISRDVTEDVSIQVTSVRKVGIISVSYRVVEASSGRVLFTDSIQTKQEFQDEGRQGVQLGNFQQETDFVELPPDIEILSGAGGLSDKVSEEIGIKLVEFLQNPEDKYAADATRFVAEGDYLGAARYTAYAIVLREIKSKDVDDLREQLMSYAMQSPPL